MRVQKLERLQNGTRFWQFFFKAKTLNRLEQTCQTKPIKNSKRTYGRNTYARCCLFSSRVSRLLFNSRFVICRQMCIHLYILRKNKKNRRNCVECQARVTHFVSDSVSKFETRRKQKQNGWTRLKFVIYLNRLMQFVFSKRSQKQNRKILLFFFLFFFLNFSQAPGT